MARVAAEDTPVLLVINKIDLLQSQDRLNEIYDRWHRTLPKAEIFPTSAKEHFNVTNLMKRIVELLPEGEPYFGKDALTDKPARFFVTEIIREKSCWTTTKKYPTAPKSSSKNLTRKAHRYTSWPWYMSNATAKKVSS